MDYSYCRVFLIKTIPTNKLYHAGFINKMQECHRSSGGHVQLHGKKACLHHHGFPSAKMTGSSTLLFFPVTTTTRSSMLGHWDTPFGLPWLLVFQFLRVQCLFPSGRCRSFLLPCHFPEIFCYLAIAVQILTLEFIISTTAMLIALLWLWNPLENTWS